MGYFRPEDSLACVCRCVACGVTLKVNPNLCPSLRVNGVRQPICRACHALWNQIHRPGLEPLPIKEGAYYD